MTIAQFANAPSFAEVDDDVKSQDSTTLSGLVSSPPVANAANFGIEGDSYCATACVTQSAGGGLDAYATLVGMSEDGASVMTQFLGTTSRGEATVPYYKQVGDNHHFAFAHSSGYWDELFTSMGYQTGTGGLQIA